MKKQARIQCTGNVLISSQKNRGGFMCLIDDNSFDTINLVNDVNFEIFVSHNLFWVPVNTLGKTRYTNYGIRQFINYTPENKKKLIGNVYEAVQLFQVGKFEAKSDVLSFEYNGLNWEHHKPGYYSVITNNGCCSSIAAWLNYLIGDRYPARGYMGFSRPDGLGHIFNYFFVNNYYYIIDISAMVYNRAYNCCRETGDKEDFLKTGHFNGCCLRANNISDFINFYLRMLKYKNVEFLFYKLPPLECIPPSYAKINDNGNVDILVSNVLEVLSETQKVKIIYNDGPNYSPNWMYYINHDGSKETGEL
jgi:hypothetical protein